MGERVIGYDAERFWSCVIKGPVGSETFTQVDLRAGTGVSTDARVVLYKGGGGQLLSDLSYDFPDGVTFTQISGQSAIDAEGSLWMVDEYVYDDDTATFDLTWSNLVAPPTHYLEPGQECQTLS